MFRTRYKLAALACGSLLALTACGSTASSIKPAALAKQLEHGDYGKTDGKLTGVTCIEKTTRTFTCLGDLKPSMAQTTAALENGDFTPGDDGTYADLVKSLTTRTTYEVTVAVDGTWIATPLGS
jgi:hypothetical protein